MGDTTTLIRHTKLAATYGLPFVFVFALFIYLNLTSPLHDGPLSVLGAFVLVYLVITSTLYAFALLARRLGHFLGWKRHFPNRTLYYLVSVIALGPVFILALNTLGRLEIKDTVLVIVLLVIGCFYVLRRSRKEAL